MNLQPRRWTPGGPSAADQKQMRYATKRLTLDQFTGDEEARWHEREVWQVRSNSANVSATISAGDPSTAGRVRLDRDVPTIATAHIQMPVNVAFVLDHSGSMRGNKLRATKTAVNLPWIG